MKKDMMGIPLEGFAELSRIVAAEVTIKVKNKGLIKHKPIRIP